MTQVNKKNFGISETLQLSAAINYYTFEEIKSFLLESSIDSSFLQSHFKNDYERIKMMDQHLTVMADMNGLFDDSSFELFKKACFIVQKFTLKPSLSKLFNIKKVKKLGSSNLQESASDIIVDKGIFEAEIVSKWWKTYLSLLEEAFESHFCMSDNWSDKNNEWFNSYDHDFLEESLIYLEDHHHWRIMLLRTLCQKENFFKKLLLNGLMKEDYDRKFDLIFQECHKNFFVVVNHNLQVVEKMESNNIFLLKLMKDSLRALTAYSNDAKTDKTCIKSGFFSKKKIKNLKHSVIQAEDGGLFLLMNSVQKEEIELLFQSGIEKEYLCKIIKKQKLVIGQGSFGKIRICLSLSGNETSNILKPGDIVCCKKTDHVNKKKKNKDTTQMNKIRRNCWNDYSIGMINEIIYSPAVYDLLIIDSLQDLDEIHCKGYTIQQFLPVLNGKEAFNKLTSPFKKKWAHQRAYFLDIFSGISKLLNLGICMTDLKPANTLYNSHKMQGSLIDLSGVIHKKNRQALEIKSSVKDIKEMTPEYTAVEILENIDSENFDASIDLCKALAFTLGKMLEENEFEDPIQEEINPIIGLLMEKDPDKRISVEKGLDLLRKVSPPELSYQKLDFKPFIATLLEEIQKKSEKFGLNNDLNLIRDCYITLEAAPIDMEKYPDVSINFTNLKEDLQRFIYQLQNTQKERTLVLLGTSGSGKSIILQLEYLDALKNWKTGDPIPIFINLSVQSNLEAHWEWICKEIGFEEFSNFNFFAINSYDVILFIDSFDEVPQKSNYVSHFYKILGNNKRNRSIICCRSEFLQKDEDFFRYFVPTNLESMGNAIKKFIVPIKKSKFHLTEDFISKYYSVWKYKENNESFQLDIKTITKKMLEPNIFNLLKTSFMIHISMMVLPKILNEVSSHDSIKISISKIYSEYMKIVFERTNAKVKEQISYYFSSNLENYEKQNRISGISDAALELATIIHLNNAGSKINQINGAAFLEKFDYSSNLPFWSNEILAGIIRSLDLVVEVKGKIPNEQITMGFSHDTIKNYYIAQAFEKECWLIAEKKIHNVNLLGNRMIIDDEVLIKFTVEIINENQSFKTNMMSLVMKSKENNNEQFVTAAANAISILIAANISFSNMDLSKICIRNAVLRDGQFSNANFTKSDLTGVILENCKLGRTIFNETIMKDVKLGIYPVIKTGNGVLSCCFDKNGQYIASNSYNSIKLWETSTGVLIKNFTNISDNITSVIFSPDGQYILCCGKNKIELVEKMTGILKTNIKVDSVTSIAFSPNGQYIMTGSQNKLIKLWDKSTKEVKKTFRGHTDDVQSVVFSPNGQLILSGSRDKTIKLWQISTGLIYSCEGHSNNVSSVAFSPDDQYILSGSWDKSIKLWDKSNGKLIQTFEGHSGYVNSVCFSPDSQYILSCSQDKTVKLWEKITGTLVKTLEGHLEYVTSACFSPDGRYIMSGSGDKTIKLWEKSTGSLFKSFNGHPLIVSSAVFSPDNQYILSGSWDNSLKLWEKSTGAFVRSFESHTKSVTSVAFSPNGQYIVSGSQDKTVKIWEKGTGILIRSLESHSSYVTSIAYSSNGQYILSGSGDKTIKIWESTGSLLRTLSGHSDYVFSVAFSPNCKYILSGSGDTTLKLWEAATGKLLLTYEGHSDYVYSVAFSPNEKYVLSGSYDKLVKLWNLATRKLIYNFQGHKSYVTSVSFSFDGQFILSGSGDYTIKIWEKSTGSLIKTLEGHTSRVTSAAFSSDSKYILSCSWDNTIKLWERSTEIQLKSYFDQSKFVKSVEFSPDDKYLLIGQGKDVELREKSTGILKKKFAGHLDSVTSVAFSRDGQTIFSASKDKTIKIWEKTMVKTLINQPHYTTSLVVALNDQYFLGRCSDNSIKIWNKSSGQLIQNFLCINAFFNTDLYKVNFQNSFQYFICSFTISSNDTPFFCKDSLVFNPVGLSQLNKKCFKDFGAIILETN